MKETKTSLILVSLGAIFLGTAGFLLAPRISPGERASGQVGGAYIESTQALPVAQDNPEPLPVPLPRPHLRGNTLPPEVSAMAVLVKDPISGDVLFEKDAGRRVPIASLTKLMTALVVERYSRMGDVVEVAPPDTQAVPYRADLVVGERLAVADLLGIMLVGSANDAALALARFTGGSVADFVVLMNLEAKALGMTDTSFTNPVGFDDPNHFSTARNLAKLVEEFREHPALLEIVGLKEIGISSLDGRFHHKAKTTNKLMLEHPEIIGLKTGYTTEAKGELIVLVALGLLAGEEEAGTYFSIVLGSIDRDADTETLMNWVNANFVWTARDTDLGS